MGDAFIVRRGGMADAFAVIAVAYPEGSVCTCSKGTKTLRAKDTSGYFLFLLPEAGTWTVSCTDGTKTKSQNVVIQWQYEAQWVELTYSLILFDGSNGGDNTTVTGGWTGGGHAWAPSMLTVSSLEIAVDASSYYSGEDIDKMWLFGTVNTIDLSPYSSLKMTVSYRGGYGSRLDVLNQVVVSGGGSFAQGDPISSVEFSSVGDVVLDISSISSSYHIGASVRASFPGVGPKLAATKIWLE